MVSREYSFALGQMQFTCYTVARSNQHLQHQHKFPKYPDEIEALSWRAIYIWVGALNRAVKFEALLFTSKRALGVVVPIPVPLCSILILSSVESVFREVV